MKTLNKLLVLIMFLACSAVILADTSESPFDGLTQDDGVKALEIADALGWEEIPREELEQVRGAPLMGGRGQSMEQFVRKLTAEPPHTGLRHDTPLWFLDTRIIE